MTPNFALSLSFDGIKLLHRVQGGWHLVGEVPVDDPDLSARLADLRQDAITLAPDGLRTKLILPNEQIKFLTIETAQTSFEDVCAALDGTTPYALDELIIDFDRTGGRTYIAAVAKETLAEAETFASQHQFAPVAFVVNSEPFTFSSEVFFGMTLCATSIIGEGVQIQRDSHPVEVIGQAVIPVVSSKEEGPTHPETATDEAVAPLAETAAPLPEPTPEPVFEPQQHETEPPAQSTPLEATPDPAFDPSSEPILSFTRSAWRAAAPDDDAEQEDTAPLPPLEPEGGMIAPAGINPPPTTAPIDEPVFSSRQSAPETPSVAPPEPQQQADLPPEPQFARRRDPSPLETALTPGIATATLAEANAPDIPAPIPAPKPLAAPLPIASPPPVTAEPRTKSSLVKAASGFLARRRAKRKERAAAAIPTGVGPIGGKHATGVGGKPKYLGLLLVLGLLVFLAFVALWASTLSDDGIAGLFGEPEPAVAPEATAVVPELSTVDETDPVSQTVVAPSTLDETPSQLSPALPQSSSVEQTALGDTTSLRPLPVTPQALGRVLSPGEANRIYAVTGVWQRAPRLPITFQGEPTLDLSSNSVAQPIPRLRTPEGFANMSMGVDAPFLAPQNPTPAGVPLPRDAGGFIIASPQGTYLPNGVLVYARAPLVTPPPRPASVTAAAEARTQTEETTAPTDIALGTPDISADAQNNPGQALDLAATVIDPDLAGIRPAPRGEDFADDLASAQDLIVSSPRPALRPASLVPQEAAAEPDVTDTSVEDAIAAATAQESSEPALNDVLDILVAAAPESALISPTARAIAASPRPDTRPANFGRVVASARANAQTETRATAPAVATSASAPATGAIPQSVASAATQTNAMNLRQINLISVSGRPNDRNATVRLSNGRLIGLEVGSSFEGGRVTAISDDALNYVVGGKTYSLQIPSG